MTATTEPPSSPAAPGARTPSDVAPRGAGGHVRPAAGDVRGDPVVSTVVSTALPRIIGDLGGSQSAYTWVVTSTLLALTVTTPIWGKLSDLFDRKLLVQTGLVLYVGGSVLAGLSQSTGFLIACRVVQGIGVGGLTALVQVILSDLVSPRERGRYAGYLGAVFGVGTVAGPLIGGVVTDCARLALVLLHRRAVRARRVHRPAAHAAPPAPAPRGEDRLLGATLIAGGVSALLIWVSLAGQQYDWLSWQTAVARARRHRPPASRPC